MYRVILKNEYSSYVIHNSSTDKKTPKLLSGSISNGINSIASFQFVILPNNIGFSRIVPYKSKITVENVKTGKIVFSGRVLKSKPKMSDSGAISKTVICEDRLAYLCDSIQPYTKEQKWATDSESTGLVKYIDYLLENHNKQVEEEKKIYRGRIEVPTLSNDNSVDKGTNYQTTYKVIEEKLIKIFGGEILLRESPANHKLYLDYLPAIGSEKKTVIELAKNMKSIDEEIDYSSLFTRLIPLGAKKKVKDDNGNETETEERVTISSVNNDCIWIDNDLITSLGAITKTVTFDDITNPDRLLAKAHDYIRNETVATEKHNLKVLDLSIIDSKFDELEVGNIHSFQNSLLELNKKLRIVKRTLDICNPTSSNITVGDSHQKLSDITLLKTKDIDDVLQQLYEVKINYAKNTEVRDSYEKLYSLIDQTYQNITLLLSSEYVSNNNYEQSVERLSKLELLIDNINLSVSEISDLSDKVASFDIKVGEITQQISSSLNITDTQYGIGSIKINDIAASEIIDLEIHPTKTDLAYLYLKDDTYLNDNLYLPNRIVQFISKEETIEYELPCDLWFLNDEIYDRLLINYERQEILCIRKVGFDANGNKIALVNEKREYFPYEGIIVKGGDYTIKMQCFSDAYIYVVAMVSNLYAAQFPTRTEFKTTILQTESKIEQSAKLKVGIAEFEAYQTITAQDISSRVKSGEIISTINQSAEKVKINANKIEITANNLLDILAGNQINMTSKNISINSTNFSVTNDGYLTSKSGKIGNWNITANSIYKGSNTFGASGAGNMYFGDNGLSISNTFKVTSSGSLVASNVDLSGKITSSSGKIGNWNITANSIYKGSNIFGASGTGNMYFGDNGLSISNTFKVTPAGALTATSGKIGGFDLSSNSMTSTYNDYRVFVGNASNGNKDFLVVRTGTESSGYTYPFYVHGDGKLHAENADITGKITATSGSFSGTITSNSGKIANWNITTNKIYGGDANTGVAVMQLPSADTTWVFAAGGTSHSAYKDCPFRVSKAGKLYATEAEITGKITATSGSISGGLVTSGISASNLTAGTFSSANISINNGTGFLRMLSGSAYHPYVSALNVSNKSNGLSFRNSSTNGDTGSQIATVHTENNNLIIDATGNILIGGSSTSNGAVGVWDGYIHAGSLNIGSNYINNNSGGQIAINQSISLNTANGGAAYVDGLYANNRILTVGGSPSTINTKKEIVKKDTSNILKILRQIDLYDYKYIDDLEDGKEDYGYIIDYLEEIPNIEKYFTFYDAERNGIKFKQIAHEHLAKFLLGAVIELNKKLESRLCYEK